MAPLASPAPSSSARARSAVPFRPCVPSLPRRFQRSAGAPLAPHGGARGLGAGLGAPARKAVVRKATPDVDKGSNTELLSSDYSGGQIFFQPQWERHRDINRYFRSFFGTLGSTVLRRITLPAMLPVAVAVFCRLYIANVGPVVDLPALPFTVAGQLISLLLVFRTNSSYARFDVGRQHWGTFTNVTRNIIRLAVAYAVPRPQQEGDEQLKKQVADAARRVCCLTEAFVWSTKGHLRGGKTVPSADHPLSYFNNAAPGVRSALKPAGEQGEKDADLILSAANMPNANLLLLMDAMRNFIRVANVPMQAALEMHSAVKDLCNAMGGSERILRTPIPLSYTRHTSRVLMMFLCLLSVHLAPIMGWLVVPCMFVLSFMLMGVDELGIEIEEPFAVLPLFGMCQNIQRDNRFVMATGGLITSDQEEFMVPQEQSVVMPVAPEKLRKV